MKDWQATHFTFVLSFTGVDGRQQEMAGRLRERLEQVKKNFTIFSKVAEGKGVIDTVGDYLSNVRLN